MEDLQGLMQFSRIVVQNSTIVGISVPFARAIVFTETRSYAYNSELKHVLFLLPCLQQTSNNEPSKFVRCCLSMFIIYFPNLFNRFTYP